MSSAAALTEQDIDYVRNLVRQHSSIVLDAGKSYLIEARLGLLARREGFENLEKLVGSLRSQRFNGLHWKAVEAMTTNETSFFRDLHPFEILAKEILPQVIEENKVSKSIAIWCAASSSGQEPHTIAMVIREKFPQLKDWNIKILATDLSKEMVARTKSGLYSQLEVNRGLPAIYLVKYFKKDGLNWQINEDIRNLVETRQMNLAEPWIGIPTLDILFIRNVLIYFDVETKKNILFKARKAMKNNAWMFLGGSESTFNLDENFERVHFEKTSCYKKKL